MQRTNSFIYTETRNALSVPSQELSQFAQNVAVFIHTENTERSPRSPISGSIKELFSKHINELDALTRQSIHIQNTCSQYPTLTACAELIYKEVKMSSPTPALSKLSASDRSLVTDTVQALFQTKTLAMELDTILKDSLYSPISNPTKIKKRLQIWNTQFTSLYEKRKILLKKTSNSHPLHSIISRHILPGPPSESAK